MKTNELPPLTYGKVDSSTTRRIVELTLLVAELSQGDQLLGRVKLNKLLYKIDFRAFEELGSPVTGYSYRCIRQGPVPTNMHTVLEDMVAEGHIVEGKEDLGYSRPQSRIVPQRRADRTVFSPDQLRIIESVINENKTRNGTSLSEESHGLAWKVGLETNNLPYEAGLISDARLSEDDIDWMRQEIQRLNLQGATASAEKSRNSS